MQLIEDIAAHAPAIAALRREIHAHPELNYEELRTAALVARKLGEWGIELHRGMAAPASSAWCTAATAAPAGAPSACAPTWTRCRCRSTTASPMPARMPGKMHACGHDGHTAMLLAAARHLARTRHFDGTVVLIFQPAEEGGGGAQAMVDEGLFERFPMEAVFGMHNWPGYPVGSLAVQPGAGDGRGQLLPRWCVRGVGGHAAAPHRGVDPVPRGLPAGDGAADHRQPQPAAHRHRGAVR